MSRRAKTSLVIIVCVLAVLGCACAIAAYVGYRVFRDGEGKTHEGVEFSWSTSATSEATSSRHSMGVLRLAGGLPATLDPAMVQDSTSAEYVAHLFSGLVSLDSELKVVPDLASSWDVSADGTTYTFFLISDATFADGRAITARDFVYSFERACSPALGSPVASSYLDDIVGVGAFVLGQADHIEGLSAPSDHELIVRIDAPKAYFLAKLTYPTAYVVDGEQIERDGDGWLRSPNGSGPFVLDELSRERIVLLRNDRYSRGPVALERVEYHLGSGLPITMYENDQLDIVQIGADEIERVMDPANPLNAELRSASEQSVQYLGLNVKVPPFDDPLVRQAFAHAIDREKIANLVLKGTATPAAGILPPALPDYDPDLEGLAYDPARARELLAASRYADELPPVVLAVSGTSGHMTQMTRAILAMVEENLGIEMRVEQVEWSYYLDDLNERRYQMFSVGWIGDYADSQNFLDVLFHSASIQNHTGYANGSVDALLEQARVESDEAKRTALYRRAERIIVQDAPWVPLTHGLTFSLVKPYVSGFESSAAIYPWLADISIAE